jgi:P27 family predicted phage terminase small subunit
MGRRGRHPDPNSKRSQAALARAAAIGRNHAPSQSQPTQPTQCPDAPDDVTARPVALAFWQAHAASLSAAGRLRADNVEGLALVAHLYADCRELAQQLAAEGWITANDKGQQASPIARLLRDARRDFLTFAREYGLTPAAETRFPPEVEHAEEDAEEAALRAFTG